MVKDRASNLPNIGDDDEDELDEEPGEIIESAPPLKIGEEREFSSSGIRKKLPKRGIGWESPEFGDEVAVHYVGTLLDGKKFVSTEDDGEPFSYKVGSGQMVSGLDHGIITMKRGESALFTLPPKMGYGEAGTDGIPPNSIIQFEVELISWITVMDVCKDGGIIKRILEKGEQTGQPGDLDEVIVKYVVMLVDGVTVAKTPEEGIKFYVKDGHFYPAVPKAIKTMSRGEKVNLVVQPHYACIGGDKDSNSGFPMVPPNSVLSINLELVSFNPVIHVTGDSKVIKKIVKEGQGSLTADDGAFVTTLSAMDKIWERRTKSVARRDKKKAVKGIETSSGVLPLSGPKLAVSFGATAGKKRGLIGELGDLPPFSTLEGSKRGRYEESFIPNWGIRTEDSVFGDTNISKDRVFKSPTLFDRAQVRDVGDEMILAKGTRAIAMAHVCTVEAYRRLKTYA